MTLRALFWTYDPALPSFRHRLAPLAHELERRGWETSIERIPKGRYLRRILARRRALRGSDVLILGKINLALFEAPLLAALTRRVVFDFDDAIWLGKPRGTGDRPRHSRLRQHKFASSCRVARLVLAGNPFLAAHAARHSRAVEIIPTSVDLASYASRASVGRSGLTVVWTGLPENLPHLAPLREPLARLAAAGHELRLRIVSSAFPDWPEIPIERRLWSSAGEIPALLSAGIGVMPLSDDDWSRGKCAFKLLQYMAAALPCVASPVGANRDVVAPDETGYWATSPEEWSRALSALLDSGAQRARFGDAGRERVRKCYDRAVVIPRAADLVEELAATPRERSARSARASLRPGYQKVR